MNPMSTFDPSKADELLREADAWQNRQRPKVDPESEFAKTRAALLETFAAAPEKVEIPYELTPAGERFARFKNVCDEKFLVTVDPAQIRCRPAYSRMMNWTGTFPGPCCTGPTGIGKTFAAWQSLRKLYVDSNMPFAWFPVRRLVAELERYEKAGHADEFFRTYDFFKILFIDDLDKINWDYESHAQLLFSFLDWVYRKKKPCVVTTNRDRAWWKAKAGDAFVRRLFDDGFKEVEFK